MNTVQVRIFDFCGFWKLKLRKFEFVDGWKNVK